MCCSCVYLEYIPKSYAKNFDVLLKLDDGSELPAHAQILARYSKVCADMLDDGPLSAASAVNKVELPITDCSRDTAVSLLNVLYSPARPTEHISLESSMDLASLAHKLDMKVYLIRDTSSWQGLSCMVLLRSLEIEHCGTVSIGTRQDRERLVCRTLWGSVTMLYQAHQAPVMAGCHSTRHFCR